jgi:hypothetical protein
MRRLVSVWHRNFQIMDIQKSTYLKAVGMNGIRLIFPLRENPRCYYDSG